MNTEVVVQGQIYTGGYLRLTVTSGLTYSSDASHQEYTKTWMAIQKRNGAVWGCAAEH